MVHPSVIEARLSHLGIRLSRWFKAEIKELEHILAEHEQIVSVVPGRYFGGFALLVATDQRLLLIDKRTFFMTVDDIRYDMISEIDFNMRLLDCTLHLFTFNKQHRFTSCKYKKQLRTLTSYVQKRVMELRQYHQTHPNDMMPASIPQQFAADLPEPSAQVNAYAQPHHTRSVHLPQRVGQAAMNAARRHHFNPNPYVRGASLITRGQASTPWQA
jgi:hypothetical protein